MARPVRSGDCVSRFMCRSFGRRIPEYVYVEPTRPGGRRDPRPKRATLRPAIPLRDDALLPGGHRAGSLRGARTPVVCARGGHARDRGAVATSSARGGFWASTRATRSLGTLARATGELQLAIAPELLASLLALYATNRYEHIICC